MKRKCDEVFCKFNDLTKSIECFYKKHNSAFTVAELVVTILVLAFLVFVLLGFMNRNQQKEYDAKNDKTVANIHALIDKASVTQTGNSIDRNDVNAIRNIITNNGLNITDLNCDECWGADDNETPGAADGTKILLNDQTVIAFVQDSGTIYIDANGAKGPNKLRRDIRELDYADTPITPGTIASCQYPRVFHESLCCPPKNADELWKTGCDRCKRGTHPEQNYKWGDEGTDKACDYECTNKDVHKDDAKWELDTTACTWGCSGNKTAQGYHAEYENVTDMTKVTPSTSNGCGYGYACPTDKPVYRTTACCANLPNNNWVWTGTKGCGKCERKVTLPPANARWKSDYSCEYECTNANVHANDAKWKFDSTACTWGCSDNKTAQGYHAEYENVTNMTKVTPSTSNGCGYGYACYDPYPNFRTTACCENLGTNKTWKDTKGCDQRCLLWNEGNSTYSSNWGDYDQRDTRLSRMSFDQSSCTYSCPQDGGTPPIESSTVNSYSFNSTTCRWIPSCKDYNGNSLGLGNVYIVWRNSFGNANAEGHNRSLKNLIGLGYAHGFLPKELYDNSRHRKDHSFNVNLVPEHCSVSFNSSGTMTSSRVDCTDNQLSNMLYPPVDIEAYIVNIEGKVISRIPRSGSTTNSLPNTSTTVLSNVRIDTNNCKGNSANAEAGCAVSGTVDIMGCLYTFTGYHRDSSPLVLDLMDDGLKFTSVEDGVMFDIDADGKIDKVAWTTRQTKFDNAFLVLDKNNNGQVDNGSELFGDQNGAETGFGELAKYDDNGDKLITKADAIFDKLRLWVDFNKDAHVDKGEWKTLEEAGITELSTEYKVETDADGNVKTDSHGNKVGFVGWFKQRVETVVNGVKTFVEKVKTMIDVFFQFK